MIHVLLRPKWQSFRNRWRKQSLAKRRSQDIAIVFFSLFIMAGMYRGTGWVLSQINSLPFLVYAPPSLPISVILLMLLGMICISSLATILGSFYLSEDIELMLASPVSPVSFYLARLFHSALTVSWMPFVFIFPVLLAFGHEHHASLLFYPAALITLVPYFFIPTAAAVIFAAVLMSIIDPRWTRILVILSLSGVLYGIVHIADLLTAVVSSRNDPNQILRFVSTITAANANWSPSSWAATAISELLVPAGHNFTIRLVLLYSVAIAIGSLGYAFVSTLHGYGYTRARNTSRSIKRREAKRRSSRSLRSPSLAIITKEFKAVFRDIAQSTQMLFLMGICLFYLANLRMFVAIDSFPQDTRLWWQNMFFVMHTAITAFFTSSICTRVVFSSISLEGRHFWLLQIAPIEIRSIMRSKFTAWLVPVAFVSAALFLTGVFVIVGRWDMLLLYLAISLFVSYGLVGLGIGLGAFFADFAWEHPSQLALSIGNFVYMLASAALVITNIFPLSILLRLEPVTSQDILIKNVAWIVLMAALVAALNISVARGAMKLGERSLKEGDLI